MKEDLIYAQAQELIGDFVFDQKVVDVFDDMIKRSVPGYTSIINMVGILAGQYVQANSNCYDLGCSLGASTLAMRQRITKDNVKIIAVDNSQAMVDKCSESIARQESSTSVETLCDDIRNVSIANASMVTLNFTLQFISPEGRREVLQKIYNGMNEGGVLIISEKIAFEDKRNQAFQEELHHTFKRLNGYSDLEISQKRTALENVLVPDTLTQHKERLSSVGFKDTNVWFQCFNFVSMIAIK